MCRALHCGRSGLQVAFLVAGLLGTACGGGEDDAGGLCEDALGLIEQTVKGGMRAQWPGVQDLDARPPVRVIRRLNGFNGTTGEEAGSWFMGFSSRRTADSFVFCRENDDACPLDEHGRFDWDHIVGDPIFSTIPGNEDFSHFWQIWVVRVPDEYEPNCIKSKAGLHPLSFDPAYSKEPLIRDFGVGGNPAQPIGFRETIVDCALVLDNTVLEVMGEGMPYDANVPSMSLDKRTGWFDGYKLSFFDFSKSEGVFPASRDQDASTTERPIMVTADINVFARRCDIESVPGVCQLLNRTEGRAFISERGVEYDFIGDGDRRDTNNIISNSPHLPAPTVENFSDIAPYQDFVTDYSPLWKIWVIEVQGEYNWEIDLIDTARDEQGNPWAMGSDVRTAKRVFELRDAGIVTRKQMPEDEAGTQIPGNNGVVFFNCPNQVPADFVPGRELKLSDGMIEARDD